MKSMLLILTVLFSLCAFAEADAKLIATWKAVPFKANNETIERDETLVITDRKFERTTGGEKRSGDLKIGFVEHVSGQVITLGNDHYEIKVSEDLKKLSLHRVLPAQRITNAVIPPHSEQLPSMVYERDGAVPDGLLEKVAAQSKNRWIKAACEKMIDIEAGKKYPNLKNREWSAERVAGLVVELEKFNRERKVTDAEIVEYQKQHKEELVLKKQQSEAELRSFQNN